MSNSSKQSRGSSSAASKPDPFAVADLDSLADRIIAEVEKPEIDREALKTLAGKMKQAATAATLFMIEAGLE